MECIECPRPKTEGVRSQTEGKSLRGIQHRPPGSGLMVRAVYLAGLPVETSVFLSPLNMALTREEKATQLTELKEKMGKAQSIIFAHYIGLTVAEIGKLRGELKKGKAEMKVAKKTLMNIAAKDRDLPDIPAPNLSGPVACIFSFADPLSGAQIAFKFSKDHQHVELIGGVFNGKILSKDETVAFAKIPGREQLLAMFAMMLRSPLYQFASLCNTPLSSFARAMSELSKKKPS